MKDFVSNQIPVYVDSAFKCLQMVENREYAIKDGRIIPVDFQNSGIMETNKKWGGGLQQMMEMKHNLSLSPMSVVTNYMSHVELFSRYKKEGAIFGLSGTLGLDSPATATVLHDLFNVQVCSIPTHKHRKLYEKHPIIVQGENDIFFARIVDVIKEEVKSELWKRGRAVLVLCEDIKTASQLKAHMLDKVKWNKGKIHLYAHSNSDDEMKSINDHTFSSGEIVIATNLAGRGTDIKLTDEVNKSGGLFCVVTFLPRNRRVELQAFGRTARKGKPGSVQCIIKATSFPPHYQGLDLDTIRKLRAEEEQVRLNELMDSDVSEVQLRETLFKQHCKFLQQMYKLVDSRDDKSVVIDSLNESWGQWLQMKSDQIALLEEETLSVELSQAHHRWQPNISPSPTALVHLPVTNFYHLIKFGNRLLVTQEKENAQKACQYYTASIDMEPRYATIAYYNRAYCIITMMKEDYIAKAISDLESAVKCLAPYINELTNVLQCVTFVSQIRQPSAKLLLKDETGTSDFSTQMQVRMQIFGYIRKKIQEAIQKLKMFQEKGDNVIAKPVGIFSLIPNADCLTHQELCTMWTLGMEVVFSVEKKPRFCWEGLLVCLLGVAEIVAGVLLVAFTAGTAASIGMYLITDGISDCIDGIEGMRTGEFDWAEWGISKATSLAISLVSGGIARFATKGMRALNIGSKINKLGKELKPLSKIAHPRSWGEATKANLKNVVKYVGKEVAQQAVMYGVQYGQEKLFELIVKRVGKECKEKLESNLRMAFTIEGRVLGNAVDELFVQRLPDSYISADKMSPGIKQEALDFFRNVGDATVAMLISDSTIQKHATSAFLSLFSDLSQKKEFKAHKRKLLAAEVAVMGVNVLKANQDLQDLIAKFIPQAEKTCTQFKSECLSTTQTVHSQNERRGYHHLRCVSTLKEDLAKLMGDVFSEAVAAILQQNLGSVVNHGVNRVGKKVLSEHVKFLKTAEVLADIKSGQRHTYLTSVEPTHSNHPDTKMVSHYAREVTDVQNPGSLLELRVAVERYGQGVIIYQEKNGKLVQDCSIPSSNQKKPNIELVYTPPSDSHSPGHYDLVNKKINSDASNCLFQAFAVGQNPHLSPSDQKERALKVRQEVAEHIGKNPHIWNEHVSQRKELELVRKGNHFARLGAGKNEMSKIVQGCHTEEIRGNELHTKYLQRNGIQCRAIRTYDGKIKEKDGCLVREDDSNNTQLRSLKVYMAGLNFEKNEGRCWDTQPVLGQLKRHRGEQKETEVAYHYCPSEGGANAGNPYANAGMTSPHFNKMERHIWSKKMRNFIGEGNDFSMFVEVKTGPVLPVDHVQFFANMNKARENPKEFFPSVETEIPARKRLDEDDQKVQYERLKLIQEKEPNAYRVESITYNIINHEGEVRTVKMPTDYELFVTAYTQQHKQPQRNEEITKAVSKVRHQKVNQPPGYRVPLLPTREETQKFNQLKASKMIRSLNDIDGLQRGNQERPLQREAVNEKDGPLKVVARGLQ